MPTNPVWGAGWHTCRD